MEFKRFEVVSDYDVQSDILYIHHTSEYQYKESVEIGDNLVLDFSEDDIPVALEVIDASKLFNVPKYSLQNMKEYHLKILVDEDIMCIKGNFILPIHNKGMNIPINEQTINDINMPYIETSFETAEA